MRSKSIRPSWLAVRGSHRGRAALVATTLAAALSGLAWADDYLPVIGGIGNGRPFVARCPAGEHLAGFELRVADDVDAIRPLCVPAYGPREIGIASNTSWYGGTGGGPGYVVCPARIAPIVTGLYARFEGDANPVINNIHLYCGTASEAPGARNSPGSTFDGPLIDDPNMFGDYTEHCPAGQVAVGIRGRAWIWLEALGLICAAPQIQNAPVKSIGKNGTGTPRPPRPPGWTICDHARDARARNSPAAPNLEAQCAAKTTITSIGRTGSAPPTPPDNGGLPRTMCDRARDARARNSPAAPNLEAQCLAGGGKL